MTNKELLNLRDRKRFPRGLHSYKKNLSPDEIELIDKYIAYRAITFNPNKLKDVERALLNFRHVVGKKLIADFTLDDVILFLRVLYRSNRSDETKKSTGEFLFSGNRAFCKWRFTDWFHRFRNFEDEGGGRLVTWKAKPLQDRLTENDMLTEEEIKRMWFAIDRLMHKVLILVHGVAPGRPIEIRHLKWSNVLFKQNRIRVYDTKTRKPREMPIDNLTASFLKRWYDNYTLADSNQWHELNPGRNTPKPSWYVFPSRKSPEKPIRKDAVHHMYKRIAKRAGITKNVLHIPQSAFCHKQILRERC